MSEANQKTLDTYNQGVQNYLDGTPQHMSDFHKEYIDYILQDISTSATILKIGSAFGRDAEYLLSQGYSVDLTDASIGFVDFLKTKGYNAELLDIIHERPVKDYDLILASAVFLHFTNDDFTKAITNVKSAFKDQGRFAFSLKNGQGEMWSDEKMGGRHVILIFGIKTGLCRF